MAANAPFLGHIATAERVALLESAPFQPVPIYPLARPGRPDWAQDLLPAPDPFVWRQPEPPFVGQFSNIMATMDLLTMQTLRRPNPVAGPVATTGTPTVTIGIMPGITGVAKK